MEYIMNKKDGNLLNDIVDSLERHSMQCRCGHLAVPLHQKGHIYKCLSCERIYDGVNYNFARLKPICSNEASLFTATPTYDDIVQVEFFDEAINLLRERSHQQKVSKPLYSKVIKHFYIKRRR